MKLFSNFALWLTLSSVTASAGLNIPSTMIGVDFSNIHTDGDRVLIGDGTPWLVSVRKDAGVFDASSGAWVAAEGLEVGQGRLIIELDRSHIPASDLALSLVYGDIYGADFVVQLLDNNGHIVALDLFSNIVTTGRDAKTDTFIISFLNYPDASKIVLRRIRGEVRIHGFTLLPVACEVPVETCGEDDLAVLVGHQMFTETDLVREIERIIGKQLGDVNWQNTTIQRPVSLAEINEVAHEALSKSDYPEFRPSTTPIIGNMPMINSASSLSFLWPISRRLNLYHPEAVIEMPSSQSSADAYKALFEGHSRASVMSIPMSTAERERFYRKYGYHPIEAVIAMGAIQVLVNVENPLERLTIPQLDAIYGTELRAGETHLIRNWTELGLAYDHSIVAYGGQPPTGTARLFQSLILQGGPFRSDMQHGTLSKTYSAIIYDLSEDRAGIAFSNLQNFDPRVKRIALARNSGEEAVSISADSVQSGAYPLSRYMYIYINAQSIDRIDPLMLEFLKLILSREGQQIVAENRLIPLTVEDLRETRSRLGF
ncbi:MAG TPA: substrate-binding domain-containing protein [Kiritimatiellia bacterium]|nr:substrate-binding domain-containing protein [Kiritimatiellia bacterium]